MYEQQRQIIDILKDINITLTQSIEIRQSGVSLEEAKLLKDSISSLVSLHAIYSNLLKKSIEGESI